MYRQSNKLLVCWILGCSLLIYAVSYGQTPPASPKVESPKKQPASSDKSAQQPKRDTIPAPPLVKAAPPSKNNQKPQQKPQQVPEQRDGRPTLDGGLVANILLAAFTFGLFLATLKLWRATEKLVKGAEDTARRQLRAYVGVERAPAEPQAGALKVDLEIKNTGQTPAYQVITWANMNKYPPPQAPSFPINDKRDRYAVIGAGGGYTTGMTMSNLSSDEVTKIANCEIPFYVWGEISYRDVFNDPHRTAFRFVVAKKLDGGIYLRPTQEGNEAD